MLAGMTEEAKPTAATEPAPTPQPEPTPAPAPAPPKYEINAPLVWTRGGTTTSSFDKHIAEEHAKAEALRAEHDEDRRAVREDGAKMYSHDFQDMLSPHVLILFDDTKLGVRIEMLCEIYVDDATDSRSFVFCCPDCLARGVPADLCQRRVSDQSRSWHLDLRQQGKLGKYIDAWGRKQMYVKAGAIVDTDIIRCPEAFCTFACRIDKDIMRRV